MANRNNRTQTTKQKEKEIEDILRVGEQEDGDIIYNRIRIDKVKNTKEIFPDENRKYEQKDED